MKIINGNILNLPENINVIIHQANTSNVMGAGIAKSIKEKWPIVFEADKLYYQKWVSKYLKEKWPLLYNETNDKKIIQLSEAYQRNIAEKRLLGHFSFAYISDEWPFTNRIIVYNAYGQMLKENSTAGCKTDYNAIYVSLTRISEHMKDLGNQFKIGIPYGMGCGLGGGNWKIYSTIILETLKDFDIVFIKYSS